MKFLSKSLFGEPTWFCVVHPNLDPTLGVAMGVKGVYRSMWELFANARGVGVSGMPTSAVFCNYQETNSNFECNNMPFFLFQTRLFAQGEHKSSSR